MFTDDLMLQWRAEKILWIKKIIKIIKKTDVIELEHCWNKEKWHNSVKLMTVVCGLCLVEGNSVTYYKYKTTVCLKQSSFKVYTKWRQSPLNTRLSLRPWPYALCRKTHMCRHSATKHGCMGEKFVISKQKLPSCWKERKAIWVVGMEYISWKGPVMSKFGLDAACFLWGFTSQHKRLRCSVVIEEQLLISISEC